MVRTNNTLIQGFGVDNADALVNLTLSNNVLTVAGSVTGSNNFTINGQPATIYHDGTFAVTNGLTINNGLNTFTAVAVSNSVSMTNRMMQFLPATVTLNSDANGNLLSDGLHGFTYDCVNELTGVMVTNAYKTQFMYDGFGRRRIRRDFIFTTGSYVVTNETRYIYDGMTVIQERDSNNVPVVSYTRGVDLSGTGQGAGGIGGLLARTDTGGSAFYHADGNGNITMMVDSSGTVKARYLYDPFGNTLGAWGSLAGANTYRFSSKEIDLNSGLYYYGFRYYQPNIQRWLTRDPLREKGGRNLYTFALNNAPDKFDPIGECVPLSKIAITVYIALQWGYNVFTWDPVEKETPEDVIDPPMKRLIEEGPVEEQVPAYRAPGLFSTPLEGGAPVETAEALQMGLPEASTLSFAGPAAAAVSIIAFDAAIINFEINSQINGMVESASQSGLPGSQDDPNGGLGTYIGEGLIYGDGTENPDHFGVQ